MQTISELQEYVNKCLLILNLPQWTVTISKHPTEEDNWADIEVSDNLYTAKMRVSSDFWAAPELEKRRVIAHELMHVHYAGVERAIESLDGILGSEGYGILENIYENEIERAADALSYAVANLLPPIVEARH
jgi:hypothetical protein